MSKKKFDPTDTGQIADELDQSGFFRSQSTPLPAPVAPSISANAESRKSATTESQRAALRKTYDKTSYRLCPDAFDAIAAAKKLLKRKFGIRASFEDIADVALILAHEDVEKNGDQSEVVKRLSAILQTQK